MASWKEENVVEEGKDKRGVRAIRKIRRTLFDTSFRTSIQLHDCR